MMVDGVSITHGLSGKVEIMRSFESLQQQYQQIRQQTVALCSPLAVEDYVVQSMPDVSPPKWHLAHTTWFFETFLLTHCPNYVLFDAEFAKRFNSYYQQLGHPYPRDKRGLLSRPTLTRIHDYRQYVDGHMQDLLDNEGNIELSELVVLGLHHEQQHQELMLMDIKYNFFMDPGFPVYQSALGHAAEQKNVNPLTFFEMPGGLVEIGYQGHEFCYDNELPVHPQFLLPYQIANRVITNEEFLEFIEDGGYQNPVYWLNDGWEILQSNQWRAPLYWIGQNKTDWQVFTLSGLKPLVLNEPVMHISYYEADAFAKWHGARLATEAEWEHYVRHQEKNIVGNFLENGHYHPQIQTQLSPFYGDVWQWTASPYLPYPNYCPTSGAIGEYNGKFMCNQFVLKGGSFATPRSHIRSTYRNYFSPDKRWQFSGIRLAKSVQP